MDTQGAEYNHASLAVTILQDIVEFDLDNPDLVSTSSTEVDFL